jgi:hypothetical protein
MAGVVLSVLAIGAWFGQGYVAAMNVELPQAFPVYAAVMDDTVPTERHETVRVLGAQGDVTVRAWDQAAVSVHLEKSMDVSGASQAWPWSHINGLHVGPDEAQAYFDAIGFETHHDDEGLVVTAQYPERLGLLNANTRFEVMVPKDSSVTVHNERGTIACSEFHGSFSATTGFGDVRLDNVDGAIVAETSGGSVVVHHGAPWPADTSLVCQTLDGPIELMLGEDSAFDLHVDALASEVTSAVPLTLDGPISGSSFEAQVGGGGPDVTLKSLDGDISIAYL